MCCQLLAKKALLEAISIKLNLDSLICLRYIRNCNSNLKIICTLFLRTKNESKKIPLLIFQKKHFHGGVSYADAPFSFLAHSQCPTESLNNMPNVGGLRDIWTRDNLNSVTHHQLETAYKAFLHLSVAYKFMAMDWSEFGHSCVNPQTDNILHREYNL